MDGGPNLDEVVDNRDSSQSRFYFYDALDRLWKSTNLSGTPLFTYVYDANGNRTQQVAPGGTTNYSYTSSTDRIAQATGAAAKSYSHDAFGNRIWAGPSAYAGLPSHVYDQSNRLIEVRDPTAQAVLGQYTYDAAGRRARKIAGGVTTLYFYDSGGHLIESQNLSTSPATTRSYVFVEGEPVGVVDLPPSGSLSFAWIHTDRLGTPLAVTSTPGSGSAKVIWRATYEPFGLATTDEDPDGDSQAFSLDLRFPGQLADAEIGEHYNRFRHYDPTTAYTQPDPIGQASSLNSYRYALNNPLRWIDRLGLSELVFDRSARKLYVQPSGTEGPGSGVGPPQEFDSSNDARSAVDPYLPGGNGPAPDGTFPTGPMIPTSNESPSSPLGDAGFIPIFMPPTPDPARSGIGIHAGRVGQCDRAGRCDSQHATNGCIRTTPEAMKVLSQDPPTRITIQK